MELKTSASVDRLGAGSRSDESLTLDVQPSELTESRKVHYRGDDNARQVGLPTVIVARAATLGSKSNALNWTWGIFFTLVVPAAWSVIWFGIIPVGPPDGTFEDKAVWVFFINPLTMCFLSFLLVSIFLTALEESQPWRPLKNYIHIVLAVYVAQVLVPGIVVLTYGTFELLAIPALALTFIVTVAGLRLTPYAWLDCDSERYFANVHVFQRICIVVFVYTVVLAAYMIANAESDGTGQGALTVALNILCFIFKKILLAFTDHFGIETAMLVSGLWIENLTDVFITLAFPTAVSVGATFGIIFTLRCVENMLYLWFQLDIWFKFRIWIKGKFKPEQAVGIEEDRPEDIDDRGHGASHPGYRRRQMRFLVMKLVSQLSSYVYFVSVAPVLRYGPNRNRFPYSAAPVKLSGTLLDDEIQALDYDTFKEALAFCGFATLAVLIAGAVIWWWMHHFHKAIIVSLRERYNMVVVQFYHYGLVLSVLIVNALIATSYVQVYYRVYFV